MIKGESKGGRHIQPVISSLSVLHRPEHTKRFTELGREEKGEGGDKGDLVEKKESPKGEREVKIVISLMLLSFSLSNIDLVAPDLHCAMQHLVP